MKKTILTLITPLIFGCTKTTVKPLEHSGDLQISVRTINEFSDYDVSSPSGAQLSIEGMNRDTTLTCDDSGIILVKDLPMGIYNMDLSHADFFPRSFHRFTFIGDTTAYMYNMYIQQKSTIQITSHEISYSNDSIEVSGTFTDEWSELEKANKQYFAVFCIDFHTDTSHSYPNTRIWTEEIPVTSKKFYIKEHIPYFNRSTTDLIHIRISPHTKSNYSTVPGESTAFTTITL